MQIASGGTRLRISAGRSRDLRSNSEENFVWFLFYGITQFWFCFWCFHEPRWSLRLKFKTRIIKLLLSANETNTLKRFMLEGKQNGREHRPMANIPNRTKQTTHVSGITKYSSRWLRWKKFNSWKSNKKKPKIFPPIRAFNHHVRDFLFFFHRRCNFRSQQHMVGYSWRSGRRESCCGTNLVVFIKRRIKLTAKTHQSIDCYT